MRTFKDILTESVRHTNLQLKWQENCQKITATS